MKIDKFKNYIYDLGILIKEKAKNAKHNVDNHLLSNDKNIYDVGYLMAYHEIVDLMKQQAEVFQIEQKDIGLDDVDVDSDLL